MILLQKEKLFREFSYTKEEDFEKDIVKQAPLLFGSKSVYIDAKKKIGARAIGNTIPDGYLFDFRDKKNPEFYIIEVELSTHDFYRHIFPQITKFFGFFKNSKSQADLIEKIYRQVVEDEDLIAQFRKHIGDKELFKFCKDTIENSHNVLLIIDRLKKELPDIIDIYTDTWGKMLKVMEVKKCFYKTEELFMVEPEFNDLEDSTIHAFDSEEEVIITEGFHMQGVEEKTKVLYALLKEQLLRLQPDLIFNPKKYYIGIRDSKNIAFVKFRKKKLSIVILKPYEEVIEKIPKSKVRELSESVQRYWNGTSCEVQMENDAIMSTVVSFILDSCNTKEE